jgi:hypothetical protein
VDRIALRRAQEVAKVAMSGLEMEQQVAKEDD